MTALTLFGLSLAPLYSAIAQVESDRGATSSNVYQIRMIYVEDVNRILGKGVYNVRSPYLYQNRHMVETMMHTYWMHWGSHYQRKTGNRVTYEVLARIHNGGPTGWKKAETVAYWNRVAAVMATQKPEEVEAWAKGGAK